MKKIIALIAAVQFLIFSFSGCSKDKENSSSENVSSSQTTEKPVIPNSESDFAYKVEGEEVTIIGYKGTSTTVNIPETIEGKKVTKISEKAFDGFEKPTEDDGKAYKTNNINSITSIHIPSSVKILETGAFTNCYSLTSLTLSEGLETIC